MNSSIEFPVSQTTKNHRIELRYIKIPVVILMHNKPKVMVSLSRAPDVDFLERNLKADMGAMGLCISTRKIPPLTVDSSSVLTITIPEFMDSIKVVGCIAVDSSDKSNVYKNIVCHNFLENTMNCKFYGLHDELSTVNFEKKGTVSCIIQKTVAHSMDVVIDGNGTTKLLGVKIVEDANFRCSGTGSIEVSFDGPFKNLEYSADGNFTGAFHLFDSGKNQGADRAQFDLSNGAEITKCTVPFNFFDLWLKKGAKNFIMNNRVENGQVHTDNVTRGSLIESSGHPNDIVYFAHNNI